MCYIALKNACYSSLTLSESKVCIFTCHATTNTGQSTLTVTVSCGSNGHMLMIDYPLYTLSFSLKQIQLVSQSKKLWKVTMNTLIKQVHRTLGTCTFLSTIFIKQVAVSYFT